MMTNQLYHTLMQQIEQILPAERITRKRVLAWLMTGLFLGRNPYANRLGNKIPGKAKKMSKAVRLRRWLHNKDVRVREWYAPIVCPLIAQAVKSQQTLRLILDGSKIGNNHQMLMIALAYRRRALPIAWTWVRRSRGRSTARKQLALLQYLRDLIPTDTPVVLLGDSEFGAISVLKQLDNWGWQYILREQGRSLVCLPQSKTWHRFDTLVTQIGQKVWHPHSYFTALHSYPTNLLAFWQAKEEEPWFLVTNISNPTLALRLYKGRMWIEEMFADFKRNGFDLEVIRFRHFLRLSRFTLAVALLYVWLVAFGAKTIKQGQRHFVDRYKQRQLSIFRIGYDMLERCLINEDTFSLRLIPYF